MTSATSTQRDALATSPDGGLDINAVQLAEKIKKRWHDGEVPDVTAALANHPELRWHRTVVLDLAYQEYLHCLQAGEEIDAETFSRRFPSFQKSLHLFIAVHSFLSQDSNCSSPQDISSWPEPGKQFLQFDLIAEIGRGSFGRVFLATEPALGNRLIVVKVAPHGGEEAEILGKLRHSNIVPIYSLQEDETGLAAFCMPYLGRATLCDVLDHAFVDSRPPKRGTVILNAVAVGNKDADLGDFPHPDAILRKGSYVDGVVHLAVQLAEALAHSHGRGICHRDLKPSNVLMTPDGRPLLLDFNLSVEQQVSAAKIGGTIPYMAPEELVAIFEKPQNIERRRYDPRSDLFSLGMVTYELLTGVLPFGVIPEASSLDEFACQLHQKQKEGPCPIRKHNDQVDFRLAHLVESCLAFEPDQRPENATELAAALRGELSLIRRTHRWMGNHRKLVAGVATTLLALILAASLFLALRPPYDVRQLQLGVAFNKQGKYAEAVEHLNNSLLAKPVSADALSARGRAYQGLKEYQPAYQDYYSAYQLAPVPTTKACEGYCLSQMKSHKAAIAAYQTALKAGYDSPALAYNNIGFSYLMLRQFDEAEKCFQLAIQTNGNLQAPRYSILEIYLYRAVHGQPIPDAAFVHATRAIEIGPPTADLCRRVSALYAMSAMQNPILIQPAIKFVEKAVELGYNAKVFASDPIYSVLQKEPAFHDALKRRATTSNALKAIQLLDPLAKP